MNRTKLIPKLTVLITVGILVFSLIPTVQAGIPPFMEDRDPAQRIKFWEHSTISASKESWFKAGIANFPEEIENNWFPKNPYKIRLYINGEEIKLRKYSFQDKNREFSIPYKEDDDWKYDAEPIITQVRGWYWYVIFEPGYFKPSTIPYRIRVEVWVRGSYGGDTRKGWRIFINRIGPPDWDYGYGPIGWEHIIHQDLIVNE